MIMHKYVKLTFLLFKQKNIDCQAKLLKYVLTCETQVFFVFGVFACSKQQ